MAGLSESRLLQLSEFVSSHMGLSFPRNHWGDLEHRTNLAARELHYADAEALLQRLFSSPLVRDQIELLANHLTISETYFWREPQVFEALRDQILPAIIYARQMTDRRLRIWSAGCASGEEPYSIAILLHKMIPDLSNWNTTLLATDLSTTNLQRATAGVYGKWSFRNAPPRFQEDYFRPADNTKFEIIPAIRKMVTFAYLNLMDDVYPAPGNNTNSMDIILCRNVLMYFTAERAQHVAQLLYQSLVEYGWLIVSSTELSQITFSQFTSLHFPGAIVYRREAEKPQRAATATLALATAPQTRAPSHRDDVTAQVEPPADLRKPELFRSAAALEPARLQNAPDPAETVRALANQGRLVEALATCESAIAADKLQPSLYYLYATILQELHRESEAMAVLRRALYLDPEFAMAYFTLGNLSLRAGHALSAKKSFQNALALLAALEPDYLVPESEGLTAGRLAAIIRGTLHTGKLA